jgi:hypothetical protein
MEIQYGIMEIQYGIYKSYMLTFHYFIIIAIFIDVAFFWFALLL